MKAKPYGRCSNCPKVLWRPSGPEWKPPQAGGPTLYVSAEQPPEFARWLAKLLRIDNSSGAVVHYEDPAAKGDLDNSVRRTAIEHVLASAMTNDMPPLHPDTAPFGYDQLIDVIKSVDQDSPTVIAAHDMRTDSRLKAGDDRALSRDRSRHRPDTGDQAGRERAAGARRRVVPKSRTVSLVAIQPRYARGETGTCSACSRIRTGEPMCRTRLTSSDCVRLRRFWPGASRSSERHERPPGI